MMMARPTTTSQAATTHGEGTRSSGRRDITCMRVAKVTNARLAALSMKTNAHEHRRVGVCRRRGARGRWRRGWLSVQTPHRSCAPGECLQAVGPAGCRSIQGQTIQSKEPSGVGRSASCVGARRHPGWAAGWGAHAGTGSVPGRVRAGSCGAQRAAPGAHHRPDGGGNQQRMVSSNAHR